MAELTRPAPQARAAEQALSHLESLSTGELIALASGYDMDIPPDLDRMFIIEELLYLDHEAKNTDNHDINHEDVGHAEFTEIAVLPKQYHIPFIEVLIRDPLWAFVFWEVRASDRNQNENEDADGFEGYCLRVIPLNEDSLEPNTAASFIVTVDSDESGRYLGFPPEDGPCFKVELCMLNHEIYTVLAESRPFKLPSLMAKSDTPSLSELHRNPLVQLSGIDRFSLVHSEDRILRSRDASPIDRKG